MIAGKCQEQWKENLELICLSEHLLFYKVIMQLRGWRALWRPLALQLGQLCLPHGFLGRRERSTCEGLLLQGARSGPTGILNFTLSG